jgi:hypothetical protein
MLPIWARVVKINGVGDRNPEILPIDRRQVAARNGEGLAGDSLIPNQELFSSNSHWII